MNNIKLSIIFALLTITTSKVWCNDGDKFSAVIAEGIDMKFIVLNEADKTCQVGYGEAYVPAISTSYTESVTIPSSVNGYSVIAIGDYAFYPHCRLSKVSIPKSVIRIGESAFHDCGNLTSVDNSENLVTLERNAFRNCTALTSIELYNNLTTIGQEAFYNCKGLSSISIPSSVTAIGTEAFRGCSGLSSVHISNIDAWCKMSFSDNYSNPLTYAHHLFINDKEIHSLVLSNNLSSIGKYAFYSCNGLNEVVIPNSVSSIGKSAFAECTCLDYVESKIEKPFAIDNTVFSLQNGSHSTLQIPYGTKNTYQQYSGWVNYFTTINETTSNYTLSIKATGNGYASYNGTTVRSKTSTFTVNEGTSATITFTPDNGYRIKSLKVNNTDVTASVSNNSYTIISISANTTLEVEFEAIPPTTYTLSVKATGNGSASYAGTTIRSKTSTFTVNEGTKISISITPDNGYRIKSVKENDTNVTSYVTNDTYTINSISRDTSVEVEFEAIPATTYTLSIKATGNGSASYAGTTIRSKMSTFTVNEGTKVSISITPDNGYRIKSVKENDVNVTSYVSNGTYTINSISKNTSVEVEFEAIPAATYTLSIKATGNGSALYAGTTIRNNANTFTVNEGANATISFSPDSGHRIKSVKVNNSNVTSSVSNNSYTISKISTDTSVEVEFEAIPATTYSLSIKATGNGSASYAGTTIRNNTNTFTVNEGTNATISFSPDSGYRIKSVKVNNSNVTASVSNNSYTTSKISTNTSVEVEFEAIPATTYTLSIKATGDGRAMYKNVIIRNTTESFTVNEGSYITVSFSADSGYRIASVKVNNTDVTSSVSNNQYTISNITANTTLEVTFEAIPVTTYTLSVKVTGNGSAIYNGTNVRNTAQTFTLEEGNNATITFSPDNGNSMSSVKVNGTNVTTQVSGNSYVINSISANTTVEVTFVEDVNALTVDGINYTVTSQSNKTVKVAGGNTGQVLTVPATVSSNGTTWTVTGIDNDALKNNTELAAVIWNPEASFTATISNPNLLLYVKADAYAPAAIKNVVVNGIASSITLTEAASGNSFYCPQSFTAQQISYTHNYSMMTGLGESRGWETIALPFDVQTITHNSKGSIVPFANWKSGDSAKPFWLYELTGSGFVESTGIKAYKPYIISMPNNPQYYVEWLLNGSVTFSASSVIVGKTDDVQTSTYKERTFVPNFSDRGTSEGLYALNVNNDYAANNSGMTEGSKFVLNMRQVHPFEAYMTTSSNAQQFIGIFEDMTTSIREIEHSPFSNSKDVYDLQGRKVFGAKKGVYISNGHKIIIK